MPCPYLTAAIGFVDGWTGYERIIREEPELFDKADVVFVCIGDGVMVVKKDFLGLLPETLSTQEWMEYWQGGALPKKGRSTCQ